jgi:4-oxalomesaconate tautomerase
MTARPRPTAADAWLTAPRQNLAFHYSRADHRMRDGELWRRTIPWTDAQKAPTPQTAINCVMMRGGTSKGLFFLARDLPPMQKVRDKVLLAALGSPDRRQIDGLGGGDSLTSKVAILAPSTDPNHDIDYLFAQVVVDRPHVDTTPSCGNILAGVACYAIDEGLVLPRRGETTVRIRAVNNRADVEAVVQTPNGKVCYQGDTVIDGVPGSGAPILLNFRSIVGSRTGKMLPTGRPRDVIDGVEVTCLDVAMPLMLARAADLGVQGDEPPERFNRDPEFLQRLEALRRQAGQLMGLGDVSDQVTPKVALISPPRHGGTVTSRYFVPEKCHATHAVTGAIAVAAAYALPESILAGTLEPGERRLEIEHPAGRIPIQLSFELTNGELRISKAGVISTARRLFEGRVLVPSDLWWPAP